MVGAQPTINCLKRRCDASGEADPLKAFLVLQLVKDGKNSTRTKGHRFEAPARRAV